MKKGKLPDSLQQHTSRKSVAVSSNALVTILICNYNYGRFLDDAIESALAQTWKNTEIIVVDDGSTDESRNILKKYEGHIRIILKENGGQASAFNAGVAEARGEIICFLDSDDTCHPNRISLVVDKYKQGRWGLVCHDLDVIDADGVPVKMKWTQYAGVNMAEGNPIDVVVDQDYSWIFSPTSGMSLPISLARKIFPLPPEKWKISADNPLAFAAACLGSVGLIPETLGSYRLHGENLFADFYKNMDARRIAAIIDVTKRYFFCQKYASEMNIDLPQLKQNYIFYRRLCLIARDKPYRFIPALLKKNIQYHLQHHNLLLMGIKIPIFFAADLFIIFKRTFVKSSTYNALKAKFDKETKNIEENQLRYILYDDR